MSRAVLLALLVIVLAFARTSGAADPPPAPTRHVTDEAGVVSATVRDDLDARLQAYEQQSGHQVIVWIGRSTGGVSIEELAASAFAAWRVGRAGLDDGAALFVMVDDRKVRIEVGYGLEDRVTDLVASRIVRNVLVPNLAAGDFDTAVVAGTEALVDAIEGRQGALSPGELGSRGPPRDGRFGLGSWIVMGLLAAGFLFLLATRPELALVLLWSLAGGGGRGRGDGDRGGFSGGGGFFGGGGRSGGGGATGSW